MTQERKAPASFLWAGPVFVLTFKLETSGYDGSSCASASHLHFSGLSFS